MEKKHVYNTHFRCLNQEQSKDDCSLQTSSILKTPKPRKPLQILDPNESDHTYTKKVSFNKAVKKKEYHVVEAETVWNATYEETVKSSSDSSHQTDSISSQSSMITGYDHLLSTRASITPTVEKPIGAESNGQFYGSNNSDENNSFDDECCLPLSTFNPQPSIDLDFTEPINNIHVSISKNTRTDYHYYMNSNLLEELNDADTELTESLPSKVRSQSNLCHSNKVNTQSMHTVSENLCKSLTLSSDSSEFSKGCDYFHNLHLTESHEYIKDLTKHKEMLLKTNLSVVPDKIFDYEDNENNVDLELTEGVQNIEVFKKGLDVECSGVKKVESEERIVTNSQISTNGRQTQSWNQDFPTKNNYILNCDVGLSISKLPILGGFTVNTPLGDRSLKSVDDSDEERLAILKIQSSSHFNNDTRNIKGSEILDYNELGPPNLLGCEKKVHNSDKNISECAEFSGLELTCNMNNIMCVPSVTGYENEMELTDGIIPHYVKLDTSTSEETMDKIDMSLTCSEKLHSSEVVKHTDGIASYIQLPDSTKESRMSENTNPYALDVTRISSEMLDSNGMQLPRIIIDKNGKVKKSTGICDMQVSVSVEEKEVLKSMNLQTLELRRVSDVSNITEFTCNLKGYEELSSSPVVCNVTTHLDEMQIDEYTDVIDINIPVVLNASEVEFTNDIHLPQSEHLEMKLSGCEKKCTLPREVEQEETSVFGKSSNTFSDMNFTTNENRMEMEKLLNSDTDSSKTISKENDIPNMLQLSNTFDLGISMDRTESKLANKLGAFDEEKVKSRESCSLSEHSVSKTDVLEFAVPPVNSFSDARNVSCTLRNPDGDKQNNSISQTGNHTDSEKHKYMNCTVLSEKSVLVDVSEKLNKYTNSCQYMKNFDDRAVYNIKEDSTAPENITESSASSFMDCNDNRENSVIKKTDQEETNLLLPMETINSPADFQSKDRQNSKESPRIINGNSKEIFEHRIDRISNSNLDSIKEISHTDGTSASLVEDASTMKNSTLGTVVCNSVAKTPLTNETSVFTISCSDKHGVRKRSWELLTSQEKGTSESCSPKYGVIDKTEVRSEKLSDNIMSSTDTTVESIERVSSESDLLITGVKILEIEKENTILKENIEKPFCSSDELNKSEGNQIIQSCSNISLEDSPRNQLHMKLNDSTECTSIPVGTVELNNSASVSHTGVNIMSPGKPISPNNIASELDISVPIREKYQNSTELQKLNVSESAKVYESVEIEKLDDISLVHNSSLLDEINYSHDEIYEHIVECVREADENLREISKIASVTNNSIFSSSMGKMEKEEEKDGSVRIETGINELEDSVEFVKKECDHSTIRENDNENGDVTMNPSIEDKILALQLRSEDDWIIKEQSETLWSYLFLFESLEFVIRLGEVVDDVLNTRTVTDIQLLSHVRDKADPLAKFLLKSLLQKLQVEALKLKCKTTEQVIEVLHVVISQVEKVKMFMRDFIKLERLEMAQFKNNCVTFDVAEMAIRVWFRIKINLNRWDDILPTDVSIENIIGKTSEGEVKQLVTAAVRGPGCLLDFTRIVNEYIKVLCKNNTEGEIDIS